MRNYILNDKREVVPCEDYRTFGRWFEQSENRVVGKTTVGEGEVSTVFLGLDHSFSSDGPPILWETMIFGGPESEYQTRCSGTWADAKAMHDRTVAMLQTKEKAKQPGPRKILK